MPNFKTFPLLKAVLTSLCLMFVCPLFYAFIGGHRNQDFLQTISAISLLCGVVCLITAFVKWYKSDRQSYISTIIDESLNDKSFYMTKHCAYEPTEEQNNDVFNGFIGFALIASEIMYFVDGRGWFWLWIILALAVAISPLSSNIRVVKYDFNAAFNYVLNNKLSNDQYVDYKSYIFFIKPYKLLLDRASKNFYISTGNAKDFFSDELSINAKENELMPLFECIANNDSNYSTNRSMPNFLFNEKKFSSLLPFLKNNKYICDESLSDYLEDSNSIDDEYEYGDDPEVIIELLCHKELLIDKGNYYESTRASTK
nr:hypothetical protein [Treponema sp.]